MPPLSTPSAYLDDDGVTALVLDPSDNFIAVRPAGGAWAAAKDFTVGDIAEFNLVKDAKAASALLKDARTSLSVAHPKPALQLVAKDGRLL